MTILSNRPQPVDDPKRTGTVTMPVRTLVALVLIAGLVVLLAWWTGLRTNVDTSEATKVYSQRVIVQIDGAVANPNSEHASFLIPAKTPWFDSRGGGHDGDTAPCLRVKTAIGPHWAFVRFGVVPYTDPNGYSGNQVVWVQCLRR